MFYNLLPYCKIDADQCKQLKLNFSSSEFYLSKYRNKEHGIRFFVRLNFN